MAVLARSSITLVTSVDIDSVYWFYLLQASTAAAPAKPTTVPATKGNAPSGWSKTEPTTVDINKTLYRVELTYFTDGTGVYSSVNQVSSYEAAKVAYNKANDVQTNLDTIQSQYGYKYKTDIVVYGSSTSTYYPVYFGYGDQNVPREVFITRSYSERAPDDWNTATHKGSLILRIKANYGGWGGATYKVEILDLSEMYSTLFADVQVSKMSGYGMAVWLRGGGTTGAIYHVYSDQQIVRASTDNNFHANLPYIGYEAGAQFGWNGGTEANPTYKFVTDAPLTAPKTDRIKALQSIVTATEAKSDAAAAQSTANTANSTANSAKTTATAAQTTANTAKTTADEAKTAATDAQTTANDAKTTAQNAESRVRFKGAVKANNASGYGAITAGNIIVGTSAGYHHLKLGKQFDINYPILYCGTNIASGGTKDDNYTVYPVTITTTQNITLTPYKAVYIKGTLAGSLFTPASTTPLTQTEPTSASDTNYYMRLGLAYDSTHMYLEADHPIYRWSAGAFRLFGSSADEIVRAWCKDTTVTTIGGMEINGAHIATKSIEADSVNVTDLSAFDATIGGFVIDADSIHTIGYGRTSFDYSSIVVGAFDTDGTENTDNKRARTPFLDGNVTNIHNDEDSGDYSFALLAWDKNTDEFKGYLTNNTNYVFSNNASNVQYYETLNITAVRNANPTYKFRLLIRTTSAPNAAINRTHAVEDLNVQVDNSDSIKLSKVDFSNYINGSRTDWRFTIGSYFGVTKNGYLYASNANISGSGTFGGTINANNGRIGNWTIGSYQSSAPSSAAQTKGSLYTGTFGSAGGIYLIPRGTTTSKTIGGGTATDWRFVIGSKFGVRNDGTLYANGANLTGSITAASLNTTDTLKDQAVNESAFSVYRWDHFVYMSASISFAGFDMYMRSWGQTSNDWRIRDGYRPPKTIWVPVVWGVNGGFKLAAMEIRSDGWINLYGYETYGGAARNLKTAYRAGSGQYGVDENNLLFFNVMWVTNQTAT